MNEEEERKACSVFRKNGRVGCCVVSRRRRTSREDKIAWSMDVYEYDDTETLANTESLLVRVAPSSCVFVKDDMNYAKKLCTILEGIGCLGADQSRKMFNTEDLNQDLACLLGVGVAEMTSYKRLLDLQVGMVRALA